MIDTQASKDAVDEITRSIRMLEIQCKKGDLDEAEKYMAKIEQEFAKLKAVLSNVS